MHALLPVLGHGEEKEGPTSKEALNTGSASQH